MPRPRASKVKVVEVLPTSRKKSSLPEYLEPRPGETLIEWRDRVRLTVARDALAKSYAYENMYAAKMLEHSIKLAGMAEPDRLSVDASTDVTWTRQLTTDELLTLDMLHRAALERASHPTNGTNVAPKQLPTTVTITTDDIRT